jgi:hypothetical protein
VPPPLFAIAGEIPGNQPIVRPDGSIDLDGKGGLILPIVVPRSPALIVTFAEVASATTLK